MRYRIALALLLFCPSTQAGTLFSDDFDGGTSQWGPAVGLYQDQGSPILDGWLAPYPSGTFLRMTSYLQDHQARGIGTLDPISTQNPLLVEVDFIPLPGIDGILHVSLVGPQGNLSFGIFAADFGFNRFILSDLDFPATQVPGLSPNTHFSKDVTTPGIQWAYNVPSTYRLALGQDSLELAFLQDGQTLWTTSYAVGVDHFGPGFHLNLAQYMYTPGRMAIADVLVDRVTVSAVPEPSSLLLACTGLIPLAARQWLRSRSLAASQEC